MKNNVITTLRLKVANTAIMMTILPLSLAGSLEIPATGIITTKKGVMTKIVIATIL
jgi:hypothetical protein